MTLVEPSASTEESFLTRAFLLLMRCTAMASESVTVGSRPSGMKATIMPREKMKELAIGLLTMKTSSMKKTTPMHRAKTVTCLVRTSSCFWRGLSGSSMFCVRLAILPNSVSIAIFVTTARPLPSETLVPAKTRLGISTVVRSSSSTASDTFARGWTPRSGSTGSPGGRSSG
jgi:hypothetical protein